MTNTYRARWAITTFVGASLFLTSCNFKDRLLAPQNPGVVDQAAVGTAAAALALRVGAIGRIRNVVDGGDQRLWQQGGHLADEYKNADFQITRQDIDRRTIATSNGEFPWATIHQPRGFLFDAIEAMEKFLPDSTSMIGELYMGLGFIEMSLAENYCNGTPLGRTVAGEAHYSGPLTNVQVYDTALAHFEAALTKLGTKTDVPSVAVRRVTTILKARVLVDKGQYAQAAALVPTTVVPTTYQYVFTTSASSNAAAEDNGHWQFNINNARVTLGDSFDIIGGQPNLIRNALPFASAGDPRVPMKKGGPTAAEDGITPMFYQQLWANRDDPIPMASGIDARLIEAEGRLNAAPNAPDIPGMMAILNALRTTSQKIGNYTVGVMPAITTVPTTMDEATTLFFREKAFWTFGRGQRLPDLRRLMRQYRRPEDQVFPTGVYSFAGTAAGTYGHDVNFPIPDAELPNPNFKACLDRLP